MEIIVNGEKKTIDTEILSYRDIVLLADGSPNYVHSVTYQSGDRAGILSPGDCITVKEGMKFNAYITGNS